MVHNGVDMGPAKDHIKMLTPNDPRLKEPDLDLFDRYFFWIFNQIGRSRVYDQGVPFSLGLHVYLDYCKLFDDSLDEDELYVLQEMDDAYVAQSYKNRE